MKISKVFGTLLNTNNYIVGDENNVILFDASAKLDDILSEVNGRKVHAIFLTHGHWDHVENIDEIQKFFNCKVYLNKNALKKLKNNEKTFNFDKIINSKLDDNKFIVVDDGDVFDFGFVKVECMHTPGHTDCSMCYLVGKENKILISGDTLFCDAIGRTDLPTSNEKDMILSLKKLMKLDKKLKVYPGHGEETTIENEMQMLASLTC